MHYGTPNSSTANGCYTKATTHTGTTTVVGSYGDWVYKGPGYGSDGWVWDPDKPNYVTSNYSYTLYDIGCGYEEKEFIRETQDISSLGPDETIISATIIY